MEGCRSRFTVDLQLMAMIILHLMDFGLNSQLMITITSPKTIAQSTKNEILYKHTVMFILLCYVCISFYTCSVLSD